MSLRYTSNYCLLHLIIGHQTGSASSQRVQKANISLCSWLSVLVHYPRTSVGIHLTTEGWCQCQLKQLRHTLVFHCNLCSQSLFDISDIFSKKRKPLKGILISNRSYRFQTSIDLLDTFRNVPNCIPYFHMYTE